MNIVGRLCEHIKQSVDDGSNVMGITLQNTNCGQKREIDMNEVAREPLRKRGTIRSTAAASSNSKSTLY